MAAGEASSASGLGWALVDDGVADRDVAPEDDVGVEPGAVHEAAHDAGLGHLLEVVARLAELDADRLDAADGEAAAHEGVDVDPARRHLAPALEIGRAHV